MGSGGTGTLDEAYQRLHVTGPEFDGWLSSHGPMAAEAKVRRGYAGQVHQWLDGYMRRLEEFPRGSGPIGSAPQPTYTRAPATLTPSPPQPAPPS